MRFIIIIIATLLVFFILKKSLTKLAHTTGKSTNKSKESIIPCDYCKVHIPASEAIQHGEHFFCKREHLDAWLKENTST